MRLTTRLQLALTSTALVTILLLTPAQAAEPVVCDPAIPGWVDNPDTATNECNSLNTLAPAAGDEGEDEAPAAEEEEEVGDQPDELNDPEPPTTEPEPPAEETPEETPEEEPKDEEECPLEDDKYSEEDGPYDDMYEEESPCEEPVDEVVDEPVDEVVDEPVEEEEVPTESYESSTGLYLPAADQIKLG